MSNVIKRRHTSQYSQIHNNPLQNDLEDLRSLGLLSYLMSLPTDWIIYKTQLHKKFSRKNADAAWKELTEKNYAIGFAAYVNGKKQHFYNVSDVPFTSKEFFEFVRDTVNELRQQGFIVKSLSSMMHGNLVITEEITNVLSVQQSKNSTNHSNVPRVQYNEFSTNSTYTKEILIKEILTNDDDIPNAPPSDDNLSSIQNAKKEIYNPNLTEDDLLCISDNIRNTYRGKIQKRSFDSTLKKCIINYKRGAVPHFENYLITAIDNKITELENRREREKRLLDLTPTMKGKQQKSARKELIPDWLREQQRGTPEVPSSITPISYEEERKRLEEVLGKYKRT